METNEIFYFNSRFKSAGYFCIAKSKIDISVLFKLIPFLVDLNYIPNLFRPKSTEIFIDSINFFLLTWDIYFTTIIINYMYKQPPVSDNQT